MLCRCLGSSLKVRAANKLEMTDRELCVVSAVGSDYAGGGCGLDLQRGSIRLVSAEERSCWQAGNRVSRDCSDYPMHVHMYALQHPRTRTLHTNCIYNFCTF